MERDGVVHRIERGRAMVQDDALATAGGWEFIYFSSPRGPRRKYRPKGGYFGVAQNGNHCGTRVSETVFLVF